MAILKNSSLALKVDGEVVTQRKSNEVVQKHWNPDVALYCLEQLSPFMRSALEINYNDIADHLGTSRTVIKQFYFRNKNRNRAIAYWQHKKKVAEGRIKRFKPKKRRTTIGRKRSAEEIHAIVKDIKTSRLSNKQLAKKWRTSEGSIEWIRYRYTTRQGLYELKNRIVPKAEKIRAILTISPTLSNKQVIAAAGLEKYRVSDVRRRMANVAEKGFAYVDTLQAKRKGAIGTINPFVRLHQRDNRTGNDSLQQRSGT